MNKKITQMAKKKKKKVLMVRIDEDWYEKFNNERIAKGLKWEALLKALFITWEKRS